MRMGRTLETYCRRYEKRDEHGGGVCFSEARGIAVVVRGGVLRVFEIFERGETRVF